MQYRNDLEAAQLRINTLEAKLDETKASLNARDAELAELRTERDRLRQAAPQPTSAPSGFPPKAIALLAGVVGVMACLGVAVAFLALAPAPKQPPATQPAVVHEEGPKAEGVTNIPPPQPEVPKAKTAGQITIPDPEPRDPAATVAGQTNTDESFTVDSVVQAARPKVNECFVVEAKDHPKAKGRFNVVFDIEPNGKVSRTKLSTYPSVDPWWSKTFETCVANVYATLTFPNTSGSKATAKGSYYMGATDLGF